MGVTSGTPGFPARPWNVAGQMQVGINTGKPASYGGRRFANICYDAQQWSPILSDGSGNARTPGVWSQLQGTLVGDGDGSGTDGKWFRSGLITTAYGAPSGTYTVFNPSGQEIGLGTFGGPTYVNWSTAKYITFTYTAGGTLFLWCRRSLANTGAGNLQIIMPGLVGNGTVNTSTGTYLLDGTTGITSGNIWNPDFLTFNTGLGLQRKRWMDPLAVIGSLEQDVADRVLPTGITLCGPLLISAIPHEFIADFSNRTGIDPWINFGVNTTPTYWAAIAAIYKANLNTNRKLLPEFTNEGWNFNLNGESFADLSYLQFTKHIATPSDVSVPASPIFLSPAHGRSVGDVLVLFGSRKNLPPGGNSIYFMGFGSQYTISAVTDADHFTLNLGAAGRSFPVGLVSEIVYAWSAEPGKSITAPIPDHNYSQQQLGIWDAFDAALGSGRVIHSCASQAANTSVTTNRMMYGAMVARAEHVHIAPYYSGLYWQVVFTGGGGKITPSIWTSVAGTVWYGVYAAGSTPTALDIARSTGTGFIGGSTQAIAASSSATPTGGTAVTGLTDGTNYAAFAVFKETATGNIWRIGTGTDAANPTNVLSTAAQVGTCFDTSANQAARSRLHQVTTSNEVAQLAAIAAVGSSATLISYEGGPDFNIPMPTTMLTWLMATHFPTTAHAGTFKNALNHLARVGYRGFNQYTDIQGGGIVASVQGEFPYDLVPNTSYAATAVDTRYATVAAFAGTVTAQASIPSSVTNAKIASPITAAPGAFPFTILSGLPAGYTYSVMSGDWCSNFSASGTSIVMNNATGLSFTGYSPTVLTIEANDGFSSNSFKLSVPIGSAWYEADASFIWDSVGASAGTTMVPPSNPPYANYGGTLSEVTGTGNPVITSSSGTVVNDVWKMSTYVFANASSIPAGINMNVPFMVAHIVDIGDQTTLFQYEMGISATGNSIAFGVGSSITQTRWRLNVNAVTLGVIQDCASCPAKGTKAVHWLFVDPVAGTAIGGVNQTPYNTGALSGLTIGSFNFGQDVRIGSYAGSATSQSQMYHGSLEFLSRAGLTQTQVLAIVQNMQTHHGI